MIELFSDREKLVLMKEIFYERSSEKKIEMISKYISKFLDRIIEEVNSKSGDRK
ncbi:MAG: hypothetical protein OEX98_03600 [Nitrosopumilus sp.]|nr:hypothetical protein [Nitrosopumilus sp.]